MGEELFENQKLADWLEDCVKHFFEQDRDSRIECAAMITVSENGYVMTGYFQADAQDMALFAHNIYSDALMEVVLNNIGKVKEKLDELEEEEDG